MSWGEPVPLGDKYKRVVAAINLSGGNTPTENGTISVGPILSLKYLAYTSGQSVLVAKAAVPTSKFEAIVDTYDPSAGTLTLKDITSLSGTFGTSNYAINLVGERGSKITSGSGAPSSTAGRVGDLYIDTVTGQVYIKT